MGDGAIADITQEWDDIPIGKALASLRRQAGMTGQELAAAVQMSQSKISRIETGARVVEPDDVAKIARALMVPESTVRRLVARSQPAPGRRTTWQMRPDDMSHRQQEMAKIEVATDIIRSFTPVVINGLLQTSEYARGLLATVHSFLAEDQLGPRNETVTLSMSDRIARQQVLTSSRKQFRIVMPESVLWNRFCEPEDMLVQIRQIREVAEQGNVRVGLIPVDERWPFPAAQDFTVYDETCVLLDMPDASILSRGSEDVATYRRLFDLLEARATTDIGGILSTHAARYYELAGSRYA